jgi:hypothetical protein
MNRTQRGGKAPGHEFWSRRPFNRCGQLVGKFAKKRTHKAERVQAVQDVEEEITEMDVTTDEGICFICHGCHPWEPDEDACEQAVIDALANYGERYE